MDNNTYRPDDKTLTLYHLHNGTWTEGLLILFPRLKFSGRERQLIELKIDKRTTSEIAKLFGTKLSTVKRLVRKIKRKFRVGEELRCDNWHQFRQGR